MSNDCVSAVELDDLDPLISLCSGEAQVLLGQETNDLKSISKGVNMIEKFALYKAKDDKECQDHIQEQLYRARKILWSLTTKQKETAQKEALEKLTAKLQGNEEGLEELKKIKEALEKRVPKFEVPEKL